MCSTSDRPCKRSAQRKIRWHLMLELPKRQAAWLSTHTPLSPPVFSILPASPSIGPRPLILDSTGKAHLPPFDALLLDPLAPWAFRRPPSMARATDLRGRGTQRPCSFASSSATRMRADSRSCGIAVTKGSLFWTRSEPSLGVTSCSYRGKLDHSQVVQKAQEWYPGDHANRLRASEMD